MLNIHNTICILWKLLLVTGVALFSAQAHGGDADVSNRDETQKTVSIYTVVSQDQLSPYGVFGLYLFEKLLAKKSQEGLFDETEFRLVGTRGSLDSLIWVEDDELGIAIAQADVLFHYLNGGHPNFPTKKEATRVQTIAKLFPETLQLRPMTSKASGSLNDYIHICGGQIGSGRLITVKNIGNVLAPHWSIIPGCQAIKEVTDQPGIRKANLLEVRIEAAGIQSRQADGSSRVFLSFSDAQLMENAFPNVYKSEPIARQANKYRINVDALLLTNRDMPESVVSTIQDILNETDQELGNAGYNESCLSADVSDNTEGCQPIKLPDSVFGNDRVVITGSELKREVAGSEQDREGYVSLKSVAQWTTFQEYHHAVVPSCAWSKYSPNASIFDKSFCSFSFGEDKYPNKLGEAEQYVEALRSRNAYENLTGILYKSIRIQKLSGLSELIADKLTPDLINYFIIGALVLSVLVYLFGKLRSLTSASNVTEGPSSRFGIEQRILIALVFVIVLHFVVATLIWITEYHVGATSKNSIAFDGITGGISYLFQHVVADSTHGKVLYSNYSSLWLAVLNIGYAAGGLFLSAGLANQFLAWIKRDRNMKYALVIGSSRSWHSVKQELSALGKTYVHIDASIDTLTDEDVKTGKSISCSRASLHLNSVKELLEKTESAIILPDFELSKLSKSDPDFWVAKQVKAIDALFKKNKIDREKVRVIAEVLNPESVDLLKENMNADEVICVQRFGGELLVQSITKPSIVKIFEEFAQTSNNDNEIYFDEVEVPSKDGEILTFEEIQAEYVHRIDRAGCSRIPIGILRNNVPLLNPVGDKAVIEEKDRIVVIANVKN